MKIKIKKLYYEQTWDSLAPVGWNRFQSGCVFAECDLFKPTTFIQNWIYMNFCYTEFYINFSRQEHQIDVLYVSFNAWDSQVSSYTPFHFSFTVPLKRFICLKGILHIFSTILPSQFNYHTLSVTPFKYKTACQQLQMFLRNKKKSVILYQSKI